MTIQGRLRDLSLPFSLDDCRAAADRIDALEAAIRRAVSVLESGPPLGDAPTTCHIDARGILVQALEASK